MDLFVARHNAQLPQYLNFKPDPGAVAVDTFGQDWSSLTLYVFPPFLMVGRYLQKIREDKVEKAVIVTPLWRSQAWYPLLLHMSISDPCLLPQLKDLLMNPDGLRGTHPDHLAGIRQSLESKGISDKAVNLICASRRRGTEKS